MSFPYVTKKWPLHGHIQSASCTSPSVLIQTTVCGECFATLGTRIRLFTSVNSLMGNQRTFLGETLTTVITTVVAYTKMGLLVGKHGRCLQNLTAEIAFHITVTDADAGRADNTRRQVIKLFLRSPALSDQQWIVRAQGGIGTCTEIRLTVGVVTSTGQWLVTSFTIQIGILTRPTSSSGRDIVGSQIVDCSGRNV